MRTVCVIPARKGSKRFPDKHRAMLHGKAMCAYTVEAALEASRVDRVAISSDDPGLRELAAAYGVMFIDRPPELATDEASFDDALRHACRVIEQRDGLTADYVVALQGNVPIRKPGQIDDLIARLDAAPDATAFCTAQHVRYRPEWAKVITDERTGACAPYINADRGYRTQDYPAIYVMDGGIHVVRAATLWSTASNRASHAWFGEHLRLVVQDEPMYSLEIDYPDQAFLAEYYLGRFIRPS